MHGRLELRSYVNSNDVEVVAFEIEATHVGHDLSRGTSVFTRTPRPEPAAPAEPAAEETAA